MLTALSNAATPWVNPTVDYHALAPEMVLAAGLCVVLLADLFLDESRKWVLSSLAGFTLLAAVLPVLTLGLSDVNVRSMFDGRYVVDNFSIVMKAMFLIAGYVVVLLSSNHVEEGEYWRGEYYFLLLSSILGMVMMASARDLVSIFVALEFLSIPAYMLAAWRKRDIKSNEAGVKYFLLGVFASAVMLYGMSLLYGAANSTLLVDLGKSITVNGGLSALHALGVVFVVVGFAFKSFCSSVSYVGTRYLRRCTEPNHGIFVGRIQGRWFHCARDAVVCCVPRSIVGMAAIHLGALGSHNDCWQRGCIATNQCGSHDCVFVY